MTTKKEGFGKTFFILFSDEQLACLGRATALFGAIEVFIEFGIMQLSGVDNYWVMDSLVGGNQFGSKVELFKKISELRLTGSKLESARALHESLTNVITKRNIAIHGR